MSPPESRARELAGRLIAFDTTSTRSNRALIDFVAGYLDEHGIDAEIVPSPEGDKANLLATVGPEEAPGVIVSGHTDVVPADPAQWTTPPFEPDIRDGRLYGRGSADMKSFIAAALAVLPPLHEQLHASRAVIALSFDEERGCRGAPLMMPRLREQLPGIRGAIIGEPTSMRVAMGHKGKLSVHVDVHGIEAHSAYPERGVNAIDIAVELIRRLRRLEIDSRNNGPFDSRFSPPYTTVHTGLVSGGSALNTVPRHCGFDFEVRFLPDADPHAFVRALETYFAEELPVDLADAGAWIDIDYSASYPGLLEEDRAFVDWARALAHSDQEPATLGFGSEAGLFAGLGIPAVVCGPGSIDQAHKPDEYIELEQIDRAEAFFHDLAARLQQGLPEFTGEAVHD